MHDTLKKNYIVIQNMNHPTLQPPKYEGLIMLNNDFMGQFLFILKTNQIYVTCKELQLCITSQKISHEHPAPSPLITILL
jgi:hypothetical protein